MRIGRRQLWRFRSQRIGRRIAQGRNIVSRRVEDYACIDAPIFVTQSIAKFPDFRPRDAEVRTFGIGFSHLDDRLGNARKASFDRVYRLGVAREVFERLIT